MRVVCRRAEPELAQTLTEIARAAKRHWGYPDAWLNRWDDELTVSPAYIQKHATGVAEMNAALVGFAAIELTRFEARVQHLWVLPAAMRQGVGRALFAECENEARQAGAKRLVIESDPHAEGFYHTLGAITVGLRRADMDRVPRSLPQMEKQL